MAYKNHHQIYTHCSKLGVCIGQYWYGDYFWGRVRGITEKGIVILDPSPKMCRNHKIPIEKLVTEGTLRGPIVIRKYEQVNGKEYFQVLSIENNPTRPYRVFGEIRRDYVFNKQEIV